MDKINDSVNRTDRLNLKSNYLKSTRKEKYSLQPSASLTVESAFVFPFFFLAIVILVLFLDLYRIQSVIQASLSQSSRELGMYAYCESDTESSPVGAVSSALCIAYAKTQLSNALKEEALPQILGHKNGISLLMSSYQNGRITLKASFLYKSPVALIPLQPIPVTIVSSVHAWTGYDSNNTDMDTSDSEEMVYVTDYQGVIIPFPIVLIFLFLLQLLQNPIFLLFAMFMEKNTIPVSAVSAPLLTRTLFILRKAETVITAVLLVAD